MWMWDFANAARMSVLVSLNPNAFSCAAVRRGFRVVGVEFLLDDFHELPDGKIVLNDETVDVAVDFDDAGAIEGEVFKPNVLQRADADKENDTVGAEHGILFGGCTSQVAVRGYVTRRQRRPDAAFVHTPAVTVRDSGCPVASGQLSVHDSGITSF